MTSAFDAIQHALDSTRVDEPKPPSLGMWLLAGMGLLAIRQLLTGQPPELPLALLCCWLPMLIGLYQVGNWARLFARFKFQRDDRPKPVN